MSQKRYLAPWRRAAVATRQIPPGGNQAEVLAALEGKPALYHCVSRVVDRTFRLGPAEKDRFVLMMRTWEAFCQVRVLTFCVMSNHFHILVEVPERPEEDPTDEQLIEHLGVLYHGQRLAEIRWELEHYRSQDNHRAAEALRQGFLKRMWDLSVFMKALKQGFSRWFNARNERKGCLWEERFKSVLVEDGHAARVVAAYIDLNPVRAGLVPASGDYRWNGYGEALAGKRKAREGLRQVMLEREMARSGTHRALHDVSDWAGVVRGYGALMAEDEERRKEGGVCWKPAVPGKKGNAKDDAGGGARHGPMSGKSVVSPLPGEAGRLSEVDLVRRRVRYFVDGLAIGSKGFVDGVFGLTPGWFGPRRTTGARKMKQAETSLRAMRSLKVSIYGP